LPKLWNRPIRRAHKRYTYYNFVRLTQKERSLSCQLRLRQCPVLSRIEARHEDRSPPMKPWYCKVWPTYSLTTSGFTGTASLSWQEEMRNLFTPCSTDLKWSTVYW